MDPFGPLAQALHDRAVQYVLIGVAGANYYAHNAAVVFTTKDRDIFVPADPENLLRAWQACESVGLELWAGNEPLDEPRDRWLAEQVIARRAVVRAICFSGRIAKRSRRCCGAKARETEAPAC